MVLQRLASFLCTFIGIETRPLRTKRALKYENPDPTRAFLPGSSSLPLPEGSGGLEDGECLCCVCLYGLEDGEDLRVLECSHRFHGRCIDRWFSGPRHRTCPMCRFRVDGEDGSQRWEELTEEMAIWFSSFHVAGF